MTALLDTPSADSLTAPAARTLADLDPHRYRATARTDGVTAALALLHAEVSPGVLPAGPSGLVLVPRTVETTCAWYQTPSGPAARTDQNDSGSLHSPTGLPDLVWLHLPGAGPQPGPDTWTVAVPWIRLGLAEHLLETAAAHLRGREVQGGQVLNLPLVRANVADVACALGEARALLDTALPDAATLRRVHNCLDEAGRRCLHLFGARGFLSDGPGSVARAGELLGDAYPPTTVLDLKEEP